MYVPGKGKKKIRGNTENRYTARLIIPYFRFPQQRNELSTKFILTMSRLRNLRAIQWFASISILRQSALRSQLWCASSVVIENNKRFGHRKVFAYLLLHILSWNRHYKYSSSILNVIKTHENTKFFLFCLKDWNENCKISVDYHAYMNLVSHKTHTKHLKNT